ncbi:MULTISPECIES: protoporphyrinogen/coproporphyrinogen oxidase [Gemella]|uniref:protoporphyrinogen/coproporphyrinogen oxidase n=1 Tax=Gemella TaxID=1378 RepID=UPI00076845DA|nr:MULTISPECIES: FAD-dependent oxidoreductase [Gemella]AME09730.1 protoporphyrinogen oxidase [Gemella sp. oral taxon 928]AXI27331.1 protoporphyrinogen oxidase [Gemella sp. ND 6198]
MKNIAIIGGDLSGVSCAYFLDKFSNINSKKYNIDIIEKDLEFAKNRFGKFQYGQEIYDNGWHNAIYGQGILFYLMIELGLHRYLIESSNTKKVFFTKEGVKYLPEKMLYGYPLEKRELLFSDLFDFKEKLSIAYNMHKTMEEENIKNMTVKRFFTSNINSKIYHNLIEPLLTSHYGSDVSNQNMVSLMPELSFLTIQKEDINEVLEDMYNKNVTDNISIGNKYRLKFTLKSFVETLESNFSDRVFLEFNRKIEKIEKIDNKYLVHSNGRIYQYDYVVLALNHNNFLPWFNGDKMVEQFFSTIKYVSNIVVTFVYKREDLHINREIGEIIFPKNTGNYVTKLEYVSNEWIDIKMSGIQIVRAYVNRQNKVNELFEKTDEQIKELIEKEIQMVHGFVGIPERYYVNKIEDNYRYCNGKYNKKINSFVDYMKEKYPNLYIIGTSKKATNLENTILEAKEIAKEILEKIR